MSRRPPPALHFRKPVDSAFIGLVTVQICARLHASVGSNEGARARTDQIRTMTLMTVGRRQIGCTP
jgi:hypothetical protein